MLTGDGEFHSFRRQSQRWLESGRVVLDIVPNGEGFADLGKAPGKIGYSVDAMRFMGSTFDRSGLYRFVAVRDMLAAEGITTATVNAHIAPLREELIAGLAATPLAEAQLLNPGGDPRARFLALRSPRASAWKTALEGHDIVTDVRGDVLRIGFGLYHDERDVKRLLGALGDLGDA